MSQREYGRLDAWHGVASIDIEQARAVGARLELRAQSEDEAVARSTYLDLIAVAAGERALDVGCGSGVVARDMAHRVAPSGAVIGVDPSPALLAVARELADQDGLDESLELREGSLGRFPSPMRSSTWLSPRPHSPTSRMESAPSRSSFE